MYTPFAGPALFAVAGLPLGAQALPATKDEAPALAQDTAPSAAPGDTATASTMAAPATQPASTTLTPIVVTAERGPQPLADAIPQTTRFDQQDIADTTARDLPGLLQLAPGAQIVRNGGPGSSSSLFLRGASAQQSLVLIDGVRVDSVSLGSAQIEQIPLDLVDHVKVVNGNVSALYGSGAIGGVVQVFTKDGGDHPPRFNFSVGYGSYHTQSQQAGVNGALDRTARRPSACRSRGRKTTAFRRLIPRSRRSIRTSMAI